MILYYDAGSTHSLFVHNAVIRRAQLLSLRFLINALNILRSNMIEGEIRHLLNISACYCINKYRIYDLLVLSN